MIKTAFATFPVLETERLILRAVESEDDRDNFLLRSDPAVNKYLSGFMHSSIEETQAFIDKIKRGNGNNEWFFWVMILKETKKFIGTVCLWNISKGESRAEAGYSIMPAFQGKGYMQETLTAVLDFGFKNMLLESIEAYTHVDNERSVNLLRRNNFVQDTAHIATDGSKDILFKLRNEK